jgi:hypothetical protein
MFASVQLPISVTPLCLLQSPGDRANDNENSKTELNMAFDRSRWGKLQSRVLYALIDLGEAKTHEIAAYCRDGRSTERQLYSQRRAARSIGARPTKRVGREWVWKLETDRELLIGCPGVAPNSNAKCNNRHINALDKYKHS